MEALTILRDAALVTLYPTTCRVCGAIIDSWRDGLACALCWQKIDHFSSPANLCLKCGLPLHELPARSQDAGRRCGRCDDLAFTFARACGPYEGALRESVLWLKMHPHIPPRLREMLRAAFREINGLQVCDSIIPIPLHPARFAERTFNQAEIIASALSSVTCLRIDTASVMRAKQTARHRAGMGMRERIRSLEGAFRVRAPRLVEGRSLLVVDDVMTTSCTAHEISQTLLEGGARSVSILTLARATSV